MSAPSIFDVAREIDNDKKDSESIFDVAREVQQVEAADEPGLIQSLLLSVPRGFLKAGLSVFGGEAPVTDEFGIPVGLAEQRAELEEMIPLQETPLTGFLERVGELAVPVPGAPLARVPLAAGLGQTAEELGFGETGQALAEIVGFIAPSPKAFLGKAKPGGVIEEGRRLGLTEAEIGPLTPGEIQKKFFGKVAAKGRSVQDRLQSTREGIGRAFSAIEESEGAQKLLGRADTDRMLEQMSKVLAKAPNKDRALIAADFQDLVNQPITGSSIINFWQDLNSTIGPKNSRVALLKGPMQEALNAIDPLLAKDFESANKLFAKWADINTVLQPKALDNFIKQGEVFAFLGGVGTGNFGLIADAAGTVAARQLVAEMLINPRFKGLASKMMTAIDANKARASLSAFRALSSEVNKIDPEMGSRMKEIQDEEFLQLLTNRSPRDDSNSI